MKKCVMIAKRRRYPFFYIYIFLNILYSAQGSLYPSGSIIAKIAVLLSILFSVLFFFRVIHIYKLNQFMRGWTYLSLIFLLYGGLHLLFGEVYEIVVYSKGVGVVNVMSVSQFEYLKYIIPSLLPMYFFYHYRRVGAYDDKFIYTLFIVYLIVAVFTFMSTMLKVSTTFDITNNAGYLFLYILPLLYYCPKYRYVFFVILYVFMILSVKRGVILTGVLCLPLVLPALINGKMNKMATIMILFFGIITIYFIGDYIYNSNDYLQTRITNTLEGKIGGREDLFDNGINYIFSQSITTFIIGNGADSTVPILGNYSHNDWIEIAICQGVIGIIIYFNYWIQSLRLIIKQKKRGLEYLPFAMMMMISFVVSFFSQSYTAFTLASSCLIGSFLANVDMGNNTKHQHIMINKM